ncbi:MAG: helix-turn-helix domain-containing protein [Candidatus Paceibacterota bacterium]|jgi:excisionase family DNA binding protein
MDKDFLTVEDIAEILKLSKRTIREKLKKGELPGKKIAGKYITTRELLKKFIDEGV